MRPKLDWTGLDWNEISRTIVRYNILLLCPATMLSICFIWLLPMLAQSNNRNYCSVTLLWIKDPVPVTTTYYQQSRVWLTQQHHHHQKAHRSKKERHAAEAPIDQPCQAHVEFIPRSTYTMCLYQSIWCSMSWDSELPFQSIKVVVSCAPAFSRVVVHSLFQPNALLQRDLSEYLNRYWA